MAGFVGVFVLGVFVAWIGSGLWAYVQKLLQDAKALRDENALLKVQVTNLRRRNKALASTSDELAEKFRIVSAVLKEIAEEGLDLPRQIEEGALYQFIEEADEQVRAKARNALTSARRTMFTERNAARIRQLLQIDDEEAVVDRS